MKFDIKRLPLAASLTSGVLYVVHALLLMVAPHQALKLASILTHNLKLNVDETKVAIGAVALGLVVVLVYTYVAAVIFVAINNYLEEQR